MSMDDLAMVLQWRNHWDVRRYMYTQHEISPSEHLQWFERTRQNSQQHLLIFEQGSIPLGFIHFHPPTSGRSSDWGFYAAPDAPKGTGRLLGQTAVSHAFSQLALHKICGQALSFNTPSIRFHQMLGFKQEGVLREQHFDGKNYHDVVCFGLLAAEWLPSL
jgi:UDP-4-amino-4,6-dideoxy-N-acetyl-beta-L-altrosamine N-acetyltransferase